MSVEAQTMPLKAEFCPSDPKKSRSRAVVEAMGHLSSIGGIPDEIDRLRKATPAVESKIATGATKAAGWLNKLGLKKLSAACLKVAAASAVIAKVVVVVAVVAVGVGIYLAVRS